jgi:hypothetical protein
MKIAAGMPQASALDVWLRDAESTDTKNEALASTDGPLATALADNPATVAVDIAPASDSAPPRDTAEILLDLDVWHGSDSSRKLTSSTPPPADDGQPPANGVPDTPAQNWIEHIFGPLL